jgi:hypothetical protein
MSKKIVFIEDKFEESQGDKDKRAHLEVFMACGEYVDVII